MHQEHNIIYIEDEHQVRFTHDYERLFKRGANRTVCTYEHVFEALKTLVMDDVDLDDHTELFLNMINDTVGIRCDQSYIKELANLIDIEKIRNRIFVSDNDAGPTIAGAHMLEAVAMASESIVIEDERPKIIALTSSNINDVVLNDNIRIQQWEDLGIEAIDKKYYNITAFWIIYKLEQDFEMGFAEFFTELTGANYPPHRMESDKVSDVMMTLDRVKIQIGNGIPEGDIGFMARLPLEGIKEIISRETDFPHVGEFITELSLKYPKQEARVSVEVGG